MENLPKRYVVPAVAIILVLAAYLYFEQQNNLIKVGTSVGDKITDLEIQSVFGGIIDTTTIDDKFIVLDFMAPWCPPCKDQIKVLQLVNQYSDVEIITVNVDPRYNMTSLMDFADEEGITWSFGHSPESALEYKVNAIPVIVIVDKEGIIRYRGFYTPLSQFETVFQQFG
ncbi:MAG: TlpA family protein disulfide reductase [Candidatus Bathyarchaeota archaeon]|nr:TlpA family protein disulfide reductase [Candidatus Bathyarchaeota archaeon]